MADEKEQISGKLREDRRSSNTIDQSLMSRSVSGSDESEIEDEQESGEEISQPGQEYADVREQQNQARIAQVNQENVQKEQGEDKGGASDSSLPNPALKATSGFLKTAWESLIETFGVSILYVDLHFLLNKVMGDKLFCKLGHEWLPPGAKFISNASKKMSGEKTGILSDKTKFEMFETGGCCAINGCCAIVLLISLAPFFLAVYVWDDPLGALKSLGIATFKIIWQIVKVMLEKII